MKSEQEIITSDLVLLGGGHSHLFVLKYLAMNPLPGLRLTLITRDIHTPYSGMLPGYLAGHYSHDEAHIDLRPLARYAGARIIHGEVNAIDTLNNQIIVDGRPAIDYDLLSINIGSRPMLPKSPDASALQIGIKPIDEFVEFWQQVEQQLADHAHGFKLVIVGAGAGGVELALSLQHRAQKILAAKATLDISLVTDTSQPLATHNSKVQKLFADILHQRGITVVTNSRIDHYDGQHLQGSLDQPLAADAVIWVTSATAPDWLAQTGLKLDHNGFIAVNSCLQSLSHPNVFAAGDIAAVEQHPRAKSGVFAVRQGLPLAKNLQRMVSGQALKPFTPQTRFLSLISTGDRYAVASRGRWALQGKWCWALKNKIDRRFIELFSDLPIMPTGAASESESNLQPMRCGGCGSKLGSDMLHQVLAKIKARSSERITENLGKLEDAAVIEPPAGMQLLQSVDHFRSFIDDPYLFGRIACNHALSDLHAMGAQADSAMVFASVAFASEEKQQQDLFQLMSGVVDTLAENHTRLLGGHSSEASEMSCGLSVNGFAATEDLLLKSGMQVGDLLILTKPIGSGVLFAADMQHRARGEWIDAALQQMLLSGSAAAACFQNNRINACTDVTGFGLAGHLDEMLIASKCAAELYLTKVPCYDGAVELGQQGVESSLLPQNSRMRHRIQDSAGLSSHDKYPLIFDPQTAGGLLASVPPTKAGACLQQLQASGYQSACIVGRVIEAEDADYSIRLTQ